MKYCNQNYINLTLMSKSCNMKVNEVVKLTKYLGLTFTKSLLFSVKHLLYQ